MSRPILWMCHPLSGDIKANLARARRWFQWLLRQDEFDIAADWILWAEALDDDDSAQRARGIAFDVNMVKRLDGVILVGGRVSAGMRAEMNAAKAAGKPVLDLTRLGEEPPVGEVAA